MSNFPHGFADGVTIRGVPIAITNPGEIFWVNSTTVKLERTKNASDNSPGTFEEPVATIAAAFDLCKASRGDIIAVMPGYTEIVSAAGGLTFDVAGVAIVGLGQGGIKPVITSSATGSTITVTAADVSVTNVRFTSSVANMAVCLSVTGINFAVDNCQFMCDDAAEGIITAISATATATGLRVTNNVINNESSVAGVSVSDEAAVGILTLADNSFIQNNFILGHYTTAAIHNNTTTAQGLVVEGNRIYNVSTTAGSGGISMTAGCTGLCNNNYIGVLETGSVDDHLVNASCSHDGNWGVNVITETAGILGGVAT